MKCVTGLTFLTGAETLLNVKEIHKNKRRYTLDKEVHIIIDTDVGTLAVHTEAGFIFDGRSGPKCIDWYAPNLGSLDERASWYMHDCLGYAQSLNFKDTNKMLEYMLRDICGYRSSKAGFIRWAVGLSSKWYGRPKPTDWCYANLGKVSTIWRLK